MATSNQINNFTGGLDLDTDKNLVKNNRTTLANDVEYSTIESNKKLSVEPFKSTKYGYTIPIAEKSYQIQRLEYFGPGTYSFDVYNESGTSIIGAPIIIPVANFAALSGISFLFALYGYTVTVGALQGDFYTFTLYNTLNSTPLKYRLGYSFNSTPFTTYTIQDAVTEDTALLPLFENNIQDVDIVFSCGVSAQVDEIGMVKKVNGTYEYTRIIRTNRFGFSDDQFFRIKLENQANDYYGAYWTNRESKPKVLYFPKEYFEDCALKYTPSNYNEGIGGYYTLSSLDKTTNLQLYNGIGRVEYSNQLQGGGSLVSGGYRYAVRFGFKGTQNVTPFSYLSQNIPVFKTSIDAPSAYIKIQGDVSGEPTTKANVVLVEGCQAEIFNYVELAYVYNANGTESAFIIGKYNLTGDTMTITHYGNESSIQSIDSAQLIDVSEVILKCGDMEIKKNRLNLANNTIATTNPDFVSVLESWRTDFAETYYSIQRKELQSVGRINLPGLTTVVQARQPNVALASLPQFGVNNTIVYTQETLDLHNEYNTVTGEYTINTAGITNVILDFSIELVYASTIDPSTCSRADVTLSRNGVAIATGTKTDLNMGPGGNLQAYMTSMELFGNNSWTCNTSEVFTITMRLYGDDLNSGGIRMGTLSYFNASYVDTNVITDFQDTRPGEYQLPENVAKYTGYMYRDRYPMYFRFHMQDDSISKPVWAFNLICTQTSFPNDLFTNDNNFNDIKVYAYYAVLNNLPIATLKSMGVKGISVWRGLAAPAVLGSGVYMPADQLAKGVYTCGYYSGIPVTNGTYGTIIANGNVSRRLGMLLSPDIQTNKTQFSGGTLVIHGTPSLEGFSQKTYSVNDSAGNQRTAIGNFAQYKGYKYSSGFSFYNAIDGQYCDFNTAYNTPFSQPSPYAPSTHYNMSVPGGLSCEVLALQTDSPVNTENPASAASDNGLFIAQYELDSAVDKENIKCVPTGCFIEINDSTPDLLSGVELFGGDTYTQKTIRRLCYGQQSRENTSALSYSFITYYAQNRVNTQLFYTDFTQPLETYNLSGAGTVLRYLFPPIASNDNAQEQFNRDLAYASVDTISQQAPYNPDQIVNSKFGSRIWYSLEKPTGSVYDFYRQIDPLSFKDLDAKNGDIVALCDVNDSMIAIQPNAVSLLPYQADVGLSSENSSSLYVGSGGVYAQREEKKSIFGASIRTAIHISKNENGNDILGWYSDTYQKMMKFTPYDGVRCISEDANTRSWFINNTGLISQDFDIIIGYNIQLGKWYITARAINKSVGNWDSETPYEAGTVVNYQVEGEQNTFEFLPNLYVCVTPNTGLVPFSSDAWEYIQPTDTRYYNYWTLIYSEKWKCFTTTHELLPRRYFEYMSFLLCPNPRPNYNVVYEMDTGDTYLQYFDQDGDFKQGQFRLAVIANERSPQRKKIKACTLNVGEDNQNNPIVTVTTPTQLSTITGDQMELRGPNLAFAVRNDGDDKPLIASWGEIKIISTAFIRITNIITTFVFRERTPFR